MYRKHICKTFRLISSCNVAVPDCKERWRNLRGSLTRHLKRNGDSGRTKKPYYLTEHMQFVVPFTKTRSRAVLPFIQDGLEDFFTTGELGSKLDDKDDLDEDFDLLGEPTVSSQVISPNMYNSLPSFTNTINDINISSIKRQLFYILSKIKENMLFY